MLKITLAFLMLVQAPIALAKPSPDLDVTQIERDEFEREAFLDAKVINLNWTKPLKFKTEKLYDAYLELSIIEDETIDVERHVRYLTQNFATSLTSWSTEVAGTLIGVDKGRYKRQNIFGHRVLRRLASGVKFRSENVRALFEKLLPEELDRVENGLLKQISELKRQESAAAPKGIQWGEVAFGAVFGELVNYFAPYLHVPNSWSLVAGLVTFAAFYKFTTSASGDSPATSTLKMAIKFHDDIECENMLSFESVKEPRS